MGDIICRICSEPWDSYGVRQSLTPDGDGDMSVSEAKMVLSGRGCPVCKGKQIIDCGKPEEDHYAFPYAVYGKEFCPHFSYGSCTVAKCIKDKDYQRPRKPTKGIVFATSVIDNDDGDPIDTIMNMDMSVWKDEDDNE